MSSLTSHIIRLLNFLISSTIIFPLACACVSSAAVIPKFSFNLVCVTISWLWQKIRHRFDLLSFTLTQDVLVLEDEVVAPKLAIRLEEACRRVNTVQPVSRLIVNRSLLQSALQCECVPIAVQTVRTRIYRSL